MSLLKAFTYAIGVVVGFAALLAGSIGIGVLIAFLFKHSLILGYGVLAAICIITLTIFFWRIYE